MVTGLIQGQDYDMEIEVASKKKIKETLILRAITCTNLGPGSGLTLH